MEGIKLNVETVPNKPDVFVVKIAGYIDTTTSSELERILQGLLREQRYKIVMDLSTVDYISSAGWGIFISEIKNIRMHNGDLKLAGMSESVSEVYELLEFSTILNSSPNVAEAVRLFGESNNAAAAKSATSPVGVARPAAATAIPGRPKPPVPAPMPAKPAVNYYSTPVTPAPAPTVRMPEAIPAPSPALAAPGNGALTLLERIKAVVRVYPEWGAWKIKSELNRRRGDLAKISWGTVRAELKMSQLDSKAARYNYSRPKGAGIA